MVMENPEKYNIKMYKRIGINEKISKKKIKTRKLNRQSLDKFAGL
jgi:hypothetical protein